MTANERLLDAFIRHQVFLLRYSGSLSRRLIDLLDRSDPEIRGLLLANLPDRSASLASRLAAAGVIVDRLRGIRSGVFNDVGRTARGELLDLLSREASSTAGIVATAAPVVLVTALPAAAQLAAVADSLLFPVEHRVPGSPRVSGRPPRVTPPRNLAGWFTSIREADLRRIDDAVRAGIVRGDTTDQIVRAVSGTRAAAGADGVVELSRRDVRSVVRTATNAYANSARGAVFAANSDIVSVEMFVATLDARTTPRCRALDGEKFPLGKGPIPPLHINCRSLRVAVFNDVALGKRPMKPVTERMLLGEYTASQGIRSVRRRLDLPRGHKGRFDQFARVRTRQLVGRVPASVTYQDWLVRQSAEFQDEVLGATRGRLFRTGKLPLSRHVDQAGRELSLAELAARDADAFRAAGLDPEGFR